jgi:hypothetical protein
MTHHPAPALHDQRHRQVIAGMAATASVVITLGLISPFVFTRSSLPFMSTPSSKVYRALTYSLRHENLNNKVFVDLGSGDGSAVYQALNAGYEKAVGIELNFTLYVWSKCRRWFFWSKEQRRRSRFHYQDMFRFDLRGSGTIMIFGVKPLMRPLSEKMARECAPGTLIFSYRFPLPTAELSSDGQLLHAKLISNDQEMMMYKVIDENVTGNSIVTNRSQ